MFSKDIQNNFTEIESYATEESNRAWIILQSRLPVSCFEDKCYLKNIWLHFWESQHSDPKLAPAKFDPVELGCLRRIFKIFSMNEIALKLDLDADEHDKKHELFHSDSNCIRIFDFGEGETKLI